VAVLPTVVVWQGLNGEALRLLSSLLSFTDVLAPNSGVILSLRDAGRGAGRDVVGISRGAVSGQLMVSDQAARSIG
jgi:hypothetical protein